MEGKTMTTGEFEIFRGDVCHLVKNEGWAAFIEKVLTKDLVMVYWEKGERAKAFYLLAMTDYLSIQHNIPLYGRYDSIRQQKLASPVYPMSMIMESAAKGIDVKNLYENSAIDEFLKYNIVEGNVDDVV